MFTFVQSIIFICGIFRQSLAPLFALTVLTTIPTGCVSFSSNWQPDPLANKRALVLENDIQLTCNTFYSAAIKANSDNQFILKFEDGENRQVFVGNAAICFSFGNFCKFAPMSFIVPKTSHTSPWIVKVNLPEYGCGGEISQKDIRHRIEIVE